ncbi:MULTISPECIES: cytochrome bc1 complex Rieske iron-sulfur subunit [unclassified Corynebacterium]|uniref:cytochrome bc1 complex Rieske iron-sulfur subunit n=1 Tax=unclassified Corynebacterium TaxID=2624378 RepID=UPI002648169F|nr:ubiquinol-cytochrome c reductase iron-sulfur subunit [Corynebacterium sp.]MDN5581394.1 ubiquinol-cytochrome c reductase iron-sulfur subunit [Corynebacterium sp.]MDN5719011.1 ubiquinol-cytochrome c reductase iron-sulfur subunit [Corynebacterium sp.]MDN6258528.1 ubiquinol-cytochrome c reductase iron-sulfur subunit [Corynebacterium sp.]MDN6386768.1 ubiquinol-cytochrome c reductase iron-sulfur subunit [Corynebacterium sp.]MDN6510484.1 ubiquinol-cytochrome c reductase iron-sulfur subunit [Coryne
MSEIKSTYSEEEIKGMSDEELARLGTELDDVTVAFRKERFPVENDPAEKRAARGVGFWWALSVVFGLAFIAVYLFWPWEYKHLEQDGLWVYSLYTPLLGVTSGLSIITLGIGAVQFSKKFVPEEIAVQKRHDGPSDEVDRRTMTALLNDAWKTSTLGRRKVLMGLGGAGVALAGVAIALPLGGIVRNPWKPRAMGIDGDGTLWTTGWTLVNEGEKVYLGRDTGAIAEEHDGHWSTEGVNRLIRVRPEDLDAGGMETVFPMTEEMVNDHDDFDATRDVYEEQMHSIHGSRNAVMLIRLRHADAVRAVQREGQEDFHYGDYYAYSKICTHIGCPTSLYEQQTNRILCPCHQSQFDALHWGKPVFGPAARALPELSINVDEDGFLYADKNFVEPVGPAFWERQS